MHKRILFIAILLSASMAFAAVDINLANEAELDGVKGFGPSTTAKILAERKKSPFTDWHDLMTRIKGIRPTKAAQLSTDGLTVNGASYSAAPSATSAPPSSPAAAAATAKDR